MVILMRWPRRKYASVVKRRVRVPVVSLRNVSIQSTGTWIWRTHRQLIGASPPLAQHVYEWPPSEVKGGEGLNFASERAKFL